MKDIFQRIKLHEINSCLNPYARSGLHLYAFDQMHYPNGFLRTAFHLKTEKACNGKPFNINNVGAFAFIFQSRRLDSVPTAS